MTTLGDHSSGDERSCPPQQIAYGPVQLALHGCCCLWLEVRPSSAADGSGSPAGYVVLTNTINTVLLYHPSLEAAAAAEGSPVGFNGKWRNMRSSLCLIALTPLLLLLIVTHASGKELPSAGGRNNGAP